MASIYYFQRVMEDINIRVEKFALLLDLFYVVKIIDNAR